MERGFSAIKLFMETPSKCFSILICGIIGGILFCSNLYAQVMPWPPPKPPVQRPEAKKPWLNQQDWFKVTQKRFESLNGVTTTDAENADFKNIMEYIADLIEQAKSSKDNQFQYSRRLAAANAMMDAADRILLTQKPQRPPEENDSRAAGFILQGCYFRVRQADYFAGISRDKKSSQYVRLASSFYQRGRSAFDAKEYGKALLLGDASTSIVRALEYMAQAATPDPLFYK